MNLEHDPLIVESVTGISLESSLTEHLQSAKELRKETLQQYFRSETPVQSPELLVELKKNITDPLMMEKTFLHLEEKEHFFFHKVLTSPVEITDIGTFQEGNLLYQTGYLWLSQVENKIYFVVPQEIQQVFQGFYDDTISNTITRNHYLYSYSIAAIHLFGVIPVEELVSLYEQHHEEKLSVEAMTEVLEWFLVQEPEGLFVDGLFVATTLLESGREEELRFIRESQQGKARYIPEKEEFLKYLDKYYTRMIPEYKAIQLFFKDDIAHLDLLPELVQEICYQLRSGTQLEDTLNTIHEYDLLPQTEDKANEMLDLLIEAEYYSRKWSLNGGKMSDELGPFDRSFLKNPTPSASPSLSTEGIPFGNGTAPSKNGACPCGSGKKYKRCCGK